MLCVEVVLPFSFVCARYTGILLCQVVRKPSAIVELRLLISVYASDSMNCGLELARQDLCNCQVECVGRWGAASVALLCCCLVAKYTASGDTLDSNTHIIV